MQALTAMTLGALALGAAAFLYDAAADPVSCSGGREGAVYFEKGKSEINEFSRAVVERVAREAKVCGLTAVVADAGIGHKRAVALAQAFKPLGLQVILAEHGLAADKGDLVADRAARIRLTMNREVG
jgi:hypothetical protein